MPSCIDVGTSKVKNTSNHFLVSIVCIFAWDFIRSLNTSASIKVLQSVYQSILCMRIWKGPLDVVLLFHADQWTYACVCSNTHSHQYSIDFISWSNIHIFYRQHCIAHNNVVFVRCNKYGDINYYFSPSLAVLQVVFSRAIQPHTYSGWLQFQP